MLLIQMENSQTAQIWTIKDNKLYLIVNTVSEHLYPLTWPTIQRMVDSFEIVN